MQTMCTGPAGAAKVFFFRGIIEPKPSITGFVNQPQTTIKAERITRNFNRTREHPVFLIDLSVISANFLGQFRGALNAAASGGIA